MRKTAVFAVLFVVTLAAGAGAQQVSSFSFERKASGDQAPQVLLDKIRLEQSQIALQSKTVPNAPYSAEATNESVQMLADGNRIVQRTTTRVYRDSAGRTRRETLDDNGQVILVAISDPTTGTSTVFDPRNNTVSNSMVKLRSSGEAATWTAQSGGTTTFYVSPADKQRVEAGATAVMKERMPATGGVVGGVSGGVSGGTFVMSGGTIAKGETTAEELGQQTIEGLAASGKRTTTVIPAGAIGNEQPIRIVSEEWFSPELQVLVLTRHSDPRTGETTYRLSNVMRTEPAKALFEPPLVK